MVSVNYLIKYWLNNYERVNVNYTCRKVHVHNRDTLTTVCFFWFSNSKWFSSVTVIVLPYIS